MNFKALVFAATLASIGGQALAATQVEVSITNNGDGTFTIDCPELGVEGLQANNRDHAIAVWNYLRKLGKKMKKKK